jgi:hypothetical protein
MAGGTTRNGAPHQQWPQARALKTISIAPERYVLNSKLFNENIDHRGILLKKWTPGDVGTCLAFYCSQDHRRSFRIHPCNEALEDSPKGQWRPHP